VRRSPRFAALSAIGLASWLTLAGCVTSTTPPEAASPTTVISSPISAALSGAPNGDTSAEAAPTAIPVNLVGGGLLDLAAYTDKPLLLWFWAPF
jgi:hypothetical protein